MVVETAREVAVTVAMVNTEDMVDAAVDGIAQDVMARCLSAVNEYNHGYLGFVLIRHTGCFVGQSVRSVTPVFLARGLGGDEMQATRKE